MRGAVSLSALAVLERHLQHVDALLRRRLGRWATGRRLPGAESARRIAHLLGRLLVAGTSDKVETTGAIAQQWGLSVRRVRAGLAALAKLSPLVHRVNGRRWRIVIAGVLAEGRADLAIRPAPCGPEVGARVREWVAAAVGPVRREARPTIAAWARDLLTGLPVRFAAMREVVGLLERHPDGLVGDSLPSAVRALGAATGLQLDAQAVARLGRAVEALVERGAVERTAAGWRPLAEVQVHPALAALGLEPAQDLTPARPEQVRSLRRRGVPRPAELSATDARRVAAASWSRRERRLLGVRGVIGELAAGSQLVGDAEALEAGRRAEALQASAEGRAALRRVRGADRRRAAQLPPPGFMPEADFEAWERRRGIAV